MVTECKSLSKVHGKGAKLEDLAVTCVCLANSQGGRIIIGFEDKDKQPPPAQIVTDDVVNATITRLRSLCFNVSLSVSNIETHDNGGQYFVIMVSPSKAIATTSNGKLYIRVGDQCQPVHGEDIYRLVSEKDTFQWELQQHDISIGQIPESNIRWFAGEIRQSNRVKPGIKELSDAEIVQHYNLVIDNKLTNLGILWLGVATQRIQLTYPITIQYIVYDEQENKTRKHSWHDCTQNPKELLMDIEKQAVELTYYQEFPHGLLRKQIRHYDQRVIRELLVNSIAHKSYTISADIFIRLYTDRLEITNPGSLPLGITKDNILHTTNRRNPHMVRILHDMELMEGEGTGYNLLYEISSREAKPFPVAESDFNTTKVTQYSKIMDEEVVYLLDFISSHYQLSQKEFIVMGIVARHKKILPSQLARELQLNEEERLRPYVSGLLEQDLLVSRGVKKGKEYMINTRLIASARINVKPTLKTIEFHRLKALIEEDVKYHPNSGISEIKTRLEDVSLNDVRKATYTLVAEGILATEGAKRNRCYSLAKKK
ncbi:MAG: ATP-binding protein [Candidatus Magnetobacterium sp. LHC-1]